MTDHTDAETLKAMGYLQELQRRMGGFSNFAISFSIICILAGGITSFHLALSAVGGAAIGLGWPVSCLLSLTVALAMAQLASAFPTAGGLYHWAAILGGRGFGWSTAWLNLAGLVAVLAAINVGTFLFMARVAEPLLGYDWDALPFTTQALAQGTGVAFITLLQAVANHRGIRLTTIITDFSGYLILAVTVLLVASLLVCAPSLDFSRLYTFSNFSGAAGGDVWPESSNLSYLFALSLLLPAYTMTGFDASAHTAEETVGAARTVPRGIIRSVFVSAVFGWIMIAAILLAMPSVETAAKQGPGAFFWVVDQVLPRGLGLTLYLGIGLAQFFCGLATVTSASRMTYAFARDGGLPFSKGLRRVSGRFRTPAVAIWTVAALSVFFTVYTPVYTTITVVCVIFLYASYVLPIALGFWHFGKKWQRFGPWSLGAWYRPVAAVAVLFSAALIWIGVQPPNDKALTILVATLVVMAAVWTLQERRRFRGPPHVDT